MRAGAVCLSEYVPNWLVCALLAVALIFCAGLGWAQRPPAEVAVENEYVRVRVNPGPQEAARFAVDTTGGDPSRASDNDKILIYGSAEPWTSYTTILVDGQPHVFGGPTERRAGVSAPAAPLADGPRVADGRILAAAHIGDIEVVQELSLARSPTTHVRDAARIAYRITNRGTRAHAVGLRVVLDTMLGSNDGAPLRAGDRAIATATRLSGEAVPEYWQAFESLSEPAVISQGTLRAAGITAPDRMEMVDWGTLADHVWRYEFPEGRDFTRAGEVEQDTAVALYWEPKPLGPGETRSCATLYGVGGVSLSPAELALGLTAPAEVDYQYEDPRPFTVTAYAENSGGFESRGTALTLELSEGLALVEGRARVSVGLLRPGETAQASWRAVPTGKATGTLQIAATVTSQNLESNRVTRDIVVNSPPQLEVSLRAPGGLAVTAENRYAPNPFLVRADVANRGAQIARSLAVGLELPAGLALTEDQAATQLAERLDPLAERTFEWRVRALGLPTGRVAMNVRATAAGAKPAAARAVIDVPELTPEMRVHPAEQTVPGLTDGQPTLVPVSVKLVPAREFQAARLSLTYNAAVLEPLYVSRGEAFVEGGRLLSPWSSGRTRPGRIADIGGERGDAPALNAAEVTLLTVVFMAMAPGECRLGLEDTFLVSAGQVEADHRPIGGLVVVE